MDPILVLIVAVLAVGAGLIWLARIARRKGQVLRNRGIVEWKDNFTNAGTPRSFALLFFGPQPRALEHLGVALAVLVVAAIVVTIGAMVAPAGNNSPHIQHAKGKRS